MFSKPMQNGAFSIDAFDKSITGANSIGPESNLSTLCVGAPACSAPNAAIHFLLEIIDLLLRHSVDKAI